MLLIKFIAALVDLTVGPLATTLPVHLVAVPVAGVRLAVGPDIGSVPVDVILEEVA